MLELEVTAGPDQGCQFPLTDGQNVLVGRGQDANLRLTDPRVSRKHFVIEVDAGKVTLLHGAVPAVPL